MTDRVRDVPPPSCCAPNFAATGKESSGVVRSTTRSMTARNPGMLDFEPCRAARDRRRHFLSTSGRCVSAFGARQSLTDGTRQVHARYCSAHDASPTSRGKRSTILPPSRFSRDLDRIDHLGCGHRVVRVHRLSTSTRARCAVFASAPVTFRRHEASRCGSNSPAQDCSLPCVSRAADTSPPAPCSCRASSLAS